MKLHSPRPDTLYGFINSEESASPEKPQKYIRR